MKFDVRHISWLSRRVAFSTFDNRLTYMLMVFLFVSYIVFVFQYITSLDGIMDWSNNPIGSDFVNYWTAAVLVLQGEVSAIFDFFVFHPTQEKIIGHEFTDHNWSYPPHFLFLIVPLGYLSYIVALVAWLAVTLAIYLWAASTALAPHRIWFAIILAPATLANAFWGQNGFLTAALFIAGFTLLQSRPYIAGVLFGVLTIKPQLGLLIPLALLAGGHWRTIASAVASVGVLILASILAFDVESWRTYLTVGVQFQRVILEQGQGLFTLMMPSLFMGSRILGLSVSAGYWVQASVAIPVAILVVLAFRRCRDEPLKLSLLAVGTILATPYSFAYDMTLVSVAVLILFVRCKNEGYWPLERIFLPLAWILPVLIVVLNGASIPIGPLILLGFFLCLTLRLFADEARITTPKRPSFDRPAMPQEPPSP